MASYLFLFFALSSPMLSSGDPSPLIELSYTFDEKTPTHPIHTKFKSTLKFNGTSLLGIWAAVNDLCSSEHAGTHMDAPLHFIEFGKTIDLIPYEKLYRIPGIKLDVVEKSKQDENYQVTPRDLEEWIETNGELPDGVVILIETGYGLKSDDVKAYSGTDQDGDMHFPGIGKEASEWMVDYKNRTDAKHGILGVGIDTYSFDPAYPQVFDAHLILLGNEIYGLENLKNLHLLPARDFTLTMLPMKIGRGTGGPTRVVAELGGSPFTYYNGAITSLSTTGLVLLPLVLLKFFQC